MFFEIIQSIVLFLILKLEEKGSPLAIHLPALTQTPKEVGSIEFLASAMVIKTLDNLQGKYHSHTTTLQSVS